MTQHQRQQEAEEEDELMEKRKRSRLDVAEEEFRSLLERKVKNPLDFNWKEAPKGWWLRWEEDFCYFFGLDVLSSRGSLAEDLIPAAETALRIGHYAPVRRKAAGLG